MKRAALLSVGAAVAVCAAGVPAIAGLMGNTSFSHHIPVRAPAGASSPQLGTEPAEPRTEDVRPHTAESRTEPTVEPSDHGDDHGVDHGVDRTRGERRGRDDKSGRGGGRNGDDGHRHGRDDGRGRTGRG